MSDQPENPANDGAGEAGQDQPGYGNPAPGYGTPAPGYGSPQPGGPVPPGFPAAPKTNSLAIGSIIASAVGLLCCIGGVVGIVLGIVALNQIKQRGEGGETLAKVGIALGAVAIVLSVVVNLVFLR